MVKPASDKILANVKMVALRTIFKYLPQETSFVFLFGSQTKKGAFSASDIDIGVLCGGKIDNSTLVKIKNEIADQAKTLRKIDVVDFSAVDDKIFLESALRRIKVWHKTSKSKTYLDSLKKRFGV